MTWSITTVAAVVRSHTIAVTAVAATALAATVATVAVVAVLAGGSTNPASSPPEGSSHRLSSSGGPLDDASLRAIARDDTYRAEERLLWRAELELTRRCMVAHGLTYITTASDSSPPAGDEWHPDMAERSRKGYGLAARYAANGETPENDRYVQRLPERERQAYMAALFGSDGKRISIDAGRHRFNVPTDGCAAQSRQQLFGSPRRAAEVQYQLPVILDTVDQLVRKDPAYQALTTRWAGCMAESGYPYQAPNRARAELDAEFRRDRSSPEVGRKEIRAAVADARCADRIGWPDATSALAQRYASTLDTGTRDQLVRLATARAGAVTRASRWCGEAASCR